MQDFTYSIFSVAAVVIHLAFNSKMLLGRVVQPKYKAYYRDFLLAVLTYYVADGAWGIFAELGWQRAWYADTVLFFLSLVAFVVMWCRFVVVYLNLGKWPTHILYVAGCALLAFNVATLASNPFCRCLFHFDEQGGYQIDYLRNLAFVFLVSYEVMVSFFVLGKALRCQTDDRRRSLMVFMFSIIMAVFIILQVFWPLTPFTALGCLIGNCFFRVFVAQDEHATEQRHLLEKALERAKAAEKARSLFFSVVSHDIRTPLNAILGCSELLRNGLETNRERDEALDSICSSGTTLLRLVNDILDLAKMETGKTPLHLQPMKLAKLTDDVFASIRHEADKKGITLVNKTLDVPVLLLDDNRFRQILFNLVDNAVRFTSRGTITVSASYSVSLLDVAVVDTGCGMPKDRLARILEPFVQLHNASHSDYRIDSPGLGLPICRRLVEIMGGELLVESELGKGSSFTIRIPEVTPAYEAPHSGDGPKTAADLKSLPSRVLVVDDSPVNRLVLTSFLKKAGVGEIDQAGDGEEALLALNYAATEQRPYDLVLSDCWMPNMDGFEFIEKARGDSRFERLSVFAVTADSECRSDERSRLFTGILIKPMTYAKLLEVLDSLSSR